MTTNSARSIYNNHPLNSLLESILTQIKRERPENFRSLSYQARYEYIRFKWLLLQIKRFLLSGNTILFNEPLFSRINNQLTNFHSFWKPYKLNPEPNYPNLKNYIDGLIEVSGYVINGRYVESNTWMSLLEESENEIKLIMSESKSTLDSLRHEVAEKDKQLQTLSQQIANYEQHIISEKGRIDQNIENFVTSFTTAQTSRAEEFEKFKKEAALNIGKELDVIKSDYLEKIKKIDENTKESIKNIKEKEVEAREIVGIIANTGTSGHYSKLADREYKSGWWMRLFAILWFVGIAVMVYYIFSSTEIGKEGYTLAMLAIRLSLSLLLLVPALYMVKEAARHWQYEKNSRRLALEFATIKPFIDSLDDNDKKEIIKGKAEIYFGKVGQVSANALVEDNLLDGLNTFKFNRTLKIVLDFAQNIINKR